MSTDAARTPAALPAAERTGRESLALPGTAIAALALGATGDPIGIGAAVLLALTWLVAPPVAVATLGTFLFVTVGPDGVLGAASIAGLALVLLAPTLRTAAPVRALVATAGLAAALGAGSAWAVGVWSLPIAAGVLLLVVGSLGYAIHRIGVVTVERPPTAGEVSNGG